MVQENQAAPSMAPAKAQTSPQVLAQIGLIIALLAVSAQVSVAIGPVPFTLQTMVVCLAAMVLTPAQAAAALAGYVLLGALGLPIFSMMRGGLAMIAGPTGGFLYGFILSAFLGSLVRRAVSGSARGANPGRARAIAADVACIVVVLAVCYAIGTAHFMVVGAMAGSGKGLVAVLALTVFPFILPDAAKGAAAALVAAALRRALPGVARR